jgi:D-glycero-alpha-D-manno-heptose-7-phosphate kinase
MVDSAVDILNGNTENLDDFGKLLHETWHIKRSLSTKVSNDYIDSIYEIARKAGALGGKILGAGGGGFILFYVKPESRDSVKKALQKLLYVPFRFDTLGSQVIYYSEESI